MYQNKSAFSSNAGYYTRTTTLSNTNGWVVTWKIRLPKADNTATGQACILQIQDGTKATTVSMHEYYIEVTQLASNAKLQLDLTQREHIFTVTGKGSDVFVFIDGKVVVDGTGLLTTSTATNQILFGDGDSGAGIDADAVWDYVKDYNTAWLPPQFTSGSLSEGAFFSGDRTSILSSLYNGGTFKSVREYCGIEREYIERIKDTTALRGITSSPTTTSTSAVVLTNLEAFVVADEIENKLTIAHNNSGVGNANLLSVAVDGANMNENFRFEEPTASYGTISHVEFKKPYPCGLHKAEARWAVTAGTATADGARRSLVVEA